MDDVWVKLKNDYICGLGSMRELAEKYSVKYRTVRARAAKEKWSVEKAKARREMAEKVTKKTLEKVSDRLSDAEADRLAKLLSVADVLSEKLAKAAMELDKAQKVTKRRHRISQKMEDDKGNPYYDEWTTEEEESQMVDAPVDRYGLRQLAATLKDLQSVAVCGNGDDDSAKEIRVVIDGDDGGELSR